MATPLQKGKAMSPLFTERGRTEPRPQHYPETQYEFYSQEEDRKQPRFRRRERAFSPKMPRPFHRAG
jgi:hypothetical protein